MQEIETNNNEHNNENTKRKDPKRIFTIDVTKEEEKHKSSLSHYLEKIHNANLWKNKDVAEIIGLDEGTYSKIRKSLIAPLTFSIITLKKFAYLNDHSIVDFIAKIEGISSKVKLTDWLETLNIIMQELGMTLRNELIHNRLTPIMKNDPEYLEKFRECFVLLILLLDLNKNDKWFNYCSDIIIKTHENINIKKSTHLENLIKRIKIKRK